MAEDGQLARIAGRSTPAEPTLAELLDPLALEERLRGARARRVEALARRCAVEEPPPRGSVDEPSLPRLVLPPAGVRVPTVPRPASGRRRAGIWAAGLFLAGLGLGAAAVTLVVVPSLRETSPGPADPPAVDASPAALADAAGAIDSAPSAPAPVGAVQRPRPVRLPDPAAEAGPPRAGAPAPTLLAALAPAAMSPAPAPAPAETAALDPAPPPVAGEAAPPDPAPARVEAAIAVPPPAPLPARVFIHFPSSAAAAAASARDALQAAGVGNVEIIPVRIAIGRSNVRFYHAADGASAATVASLLAPGLPPGDAPQARDFTDYATPPAPGKVEVWLAGTPAGGASAPRRPTPAAPRPAATAIPPDILPGPIPPEDQAEAVERILVQRAVERLMRQRNGR